MSKLPRLADLLNCPETSQSDESKQLVFSDSFHEDFPKKGVCLITLHLHSSAPWLEYENTVHGFPMDRGIVYLTSKDVFDILSMLGYGADDPGEESLG